MVFTDLTVGIVASLLWAAPTETSTETIVIYGQKSRPVGLFEDPTVAAESVVLSDLVSVSETLGDVLVETTGVRVLRSGGEGAFEGLAIRGSEPQHTAVLVGDVPISGTDRGPIDLSLLPLEAFERVELYRGAGPAWIDQGQIGGLVRLIPRTGDASRVQGRVGAGSFGGYRGAAEVSVSEDDHGWLVAVGGRTRGNDYAFLDDRATLFTPEDDRIVRRRNARSSQVHGFAQADWHVGRHRFDVVALGLHRDRGEPGPGHRQAQSARRARTRLFGTLAHTFEGDRLRVQSVLTGGWERDAFEDRLSEIGLGREDTDDRFYGLGARVASRYRAMSWLDTTVVGSFRYDRYRPRNAFAVPGDQPSQRLSGRGTAEARIHGTWGAWAFEARPSVSLGISEARLVSRSVEGLRTRSARDRWPNFRFAIFAAPRRWLSLQASVASGARLPTILELFGNRGTLLANPQLKPERALTWDVGLRSRRRVRLGGRPLLLRLEARGFGREVSDLIRYRRTAQFTAVAENIESGQVFGGEGSIKVALPPWLSVDAQAAWLRARDDLNRSLPLRSTWTGSAQAEARTEVLWPGWLDEVRARLTFLFVGQNRFDPANLSGNDDRQVWGAALSSVHDGGRFRIQAQVRDVFDVGGSDLLGFPLPGRRFDISLTWREQL